jgi:ATP-dependent protease ClpP protease subunit
MPQWTPRRKYKNEDADSIAEIRISEKDSSPTSLTGNKLYFYGDIDGDTALSWNKQLDEISRNLKVAQSLYDLATPPILQIFIYSDGGDLFSSLSIAGRIELLKSKGFIIDTFIDGFCASGATLISVVGNKRFIHKHACMLIHQLSSSFWGTYKEFQDENKNVEMMMNKIHNVYRIYAKFNKEELDNILSHDIYLSPDECLKFGLVDEIL